MDRGVIEPHAISGPLAIASSEISAFSSKPGGVNIFGGFSKDGGRGWVATDSVLDLVCSKTGNKLSSFNFSQVAGSSSAITCVKDYWCQGTYQVLVGLRTASDKGMVCRFHPHSSKLLSAVTFPQVVTAIESVTSAGGVDAPNFALSDELRRFFGIVAVGTKGGHVYLLDMKLDEQVELWDTPRARLAQIVLAKEGDVDQRRLKAAARGEHLCLDLNGESFSYYSFNYCKPDGSVFKAFPIGDVSVTSLTYVPQIGSLAVGFSFGSFQLWRMLDTELEYSGPLSRHPSPVTHFTYQEPEDDPQNFCYLWVARGPVLSDTKEEEALTDIHLFQLAYENKAQHPRHGHMFQDLVDCIGRFEHCLTADPFDSSDVNSLGSRLLACYTLERALPQGYKVHDDSTAEEEANPMDLSLAVFVWEGCPANGELQDSTRHFLAVFDLDRYYQAQMPAFIKSDELREPTSYFSFYNLEAVVDAAAPDFALNVHLDKTSLTKYQSTFQPVPEQHLHPSALSFNLVCLADGNLVHATFLGSQKRILADLCSQGPVVLREPRPFYLRCWNAHLLPRHTDQIPSNISQGQQREGLLTLALEHNQLGFLVACISSWSQGDFTSGMNLRSILEWGWGKVASIKQGVDEICVPFYDGYGTFVDSQTFRLLETYSTQLRHMVNLFQALLDQSATTTDQGVKDLETKLGVVTLLSQHLQMVLWFAHSGLLPECADDMGSPLEGQFCYPSSLLRQTYAQRRAELVRMCRNSGSSDIMLIDGLVTEAGSALTSLWDRKEEGGTGAYPPPSLHALLDMYLLEDVPLAMKHCIVGYLLLDIISFSNDAKHSEMVGKIQQFHQVFSLPLGLTKLLQAFWLLDHRDYEEALNMLLDPNTDNDVLSWQHTRIVKTFLYHGQAKRALQYVRCVRPTLDSPDDVKLHLTVLLANGLTAEAFQFQREYRDPATMDELLYHIFLGSQQTKTMDQLLRLPFDDVEEAVLERYLLESTEPNSRELLVMHYLQRTRFVDAVRLNEKLKQQAMMGDKDPLARERTSARNIITESYVNVLPRVQRRLAFDPETRHKKPVGIRREVARPKPLSAVVNPAKSSKVISHALLLNAVLDRIAEARDVIRADETPIKNLDDTFDNSPCMEPFVGTPMTPRNRTIRSADVSVVYPEMLEGDESAPYQALSTSLNLSVTQTLRGLSNVDTPKALKEPFKRPPLDYSGAEALSLLQTPPVKRRVPVVKQEPQIAPPTPQSILKVRKVIRRSPSPPKMVTERALGPTALDVAMPSPPKFQRKTLSFVEDDSVKPKEATPGRHIRFSDDTISPQSTPSPDINELLPEPPDFSLRRETAASASPTLDPQEWGTPPISPQASPTKGATDTPPFQSPQEALTFHSPLRVDPTPQQAPKESPVAMETETETEQEEVKEYLILTPKSKAPILRGSRVLTPKQKPPTPLQCSQLQFQQQEDIAVFEPFVEDDSQTPPIPEDMVQINLDSIRRSTSPRDRDRDQEEGVDDEEITFNFTLRHGQEEEEEDEGEGEVVPPAGVQGVAEEDEEGDFMLPASAAEDVEMEEQMQTEDGEGSKSTSPDVPPSFLFEELQRKPIHPLSPFQFSHPSPSTSAALPPQGGLTTTLPSPPRVSRDIAIEQAFLDGSTSPTTGSNWTLKFDQEDDEEEEEYGMEEEEVIIDPEPKVRFGQEQVFDIPSAGPKHSLESVEIQTSPMSCLTSDLPPQLATRRAEMAEMSVQTTPGLALRQREVQKTPSRVPFEESLGQTEQERSREGGASAGETAVEVAKEVVVKEAKAASPPRLAVIKQPTDEKKQAPPSPRTPKSKVKTPPRSSPRIRARLLQQKQEEEMATQAQHLTPTQQRTPAHHRTPPQDLTRDQDSTRDQSSHPDQPSFIFSPPLTRSRGRRSARKRVTAETAPPRHPSLNQTAETMLTFPSPSPQPSRGGVSLLEPAGGSVGRSGRRGRQPLAASAAANSSSVMTQIKDKPAVITPTRKTRPLHRPSPMSPEDSVVLLSPAVPDTEADSELRAQRRNPRRAVRVNPHSMTLRTPKERKKTTKVKAW